MNTEEEPVNNINALDNLKLKKRMLAVRGEALRFLREERAGDAGHARLNAMIARICRDNEHLGMCCVPILEGTPLPCLCAGQAVFGGDALQPDSRIRVHSISKLLGGLVLMRLWEDGRIDLDKDISEYFGYAIRNPRFRNVPITLRQLMTHTSSLHDNGDYLDMGTERMLPLSQYFQRDRCARNFTESKPGTHYAYSNLGAGMQGALVEKLTGRDFDAVARELLFEPLGLDAGYYPQRLQHKELLANIHRWPDFHTSYDARAIAASEPEAYPDPEMHYTTMPGRVNISMPDLAKVALLLLNGGELDGVRLLQPETVRGILQPQSGIGSVARAERGLNMDIAVDAFAPGRTMYGHQGGAYGGTAEFWIEPETRCGVVLATTGGHYRAIRPFAQVGHEAVTAMFAALDRMRGAVP